MHEPTRPEPGLLAAAWGTDAKPVLTDEDMTGVITRVLAAVAEQHLAGPHVYLSTGCRHGNHGYCQSHTGAAGRKIPARCKFCSAPCRCPCHGMHATSTVHAAPPDGSGLTPCCGLTPFELPRTDRLTAEPGQVTCAHRPARPTAGPRQTPRPMPGRSNG